MSSIIYFRSVTVIYMGSQQDLKLGEYEMHKPKQVPTKQPVPQFKVRSSVSAGGSVESCMKNLDYWKKAYDARCLLK
jgi:hypothetical protein